MTLHLLMLSYKRAYAQAEQKQKAWDAIDVAAPVLTGTPEYETRVKARVELAAATKHLDLCAEKVCHGLFDELGLSLESESTLEEELTAAVRIQGLVRR